MLIGLGIRIISTAYWRRQVSFFRSLSRYRRGLETCPQAKTFKSERSATTLFSSLFSDASERRVWLSFESQILAFTFERFCLYRFISIFYLQSCRGLIFSKLSERSRESNLISAIRLIAIIKSSYKNETILFSKNFFSIFDFKSGVKINK